MDNPSNLNFSSKDITKKDVSFNVKEKTSKQLRSRVKAFGKKIADAPLLRGKRKFTTIPVACGTLILAVFIPIIVVSIVNTVSTPSPTPEEEQANEQEVISEVADTVNNIDPDASDETKEAVLADLDKKIAAATDASNRLFISINKASALLKYARYDEAITIMKDSISELSKMKSWESLRDAQAFLSVIYEVKGDKGAAIEYLRAAIQTIEKAPENISGREWYESEISRLENS